MHRGGFTLQILSKKRLSHLLEYLHLLLIYQPEQIGLFLSKINNIILVKDSLEKVHDDCHYLWATRLLEILILMEVLFHSGCAYSRAYRLEQIGFLYRNQYVLG